MSARDAIELLDYSPLAEQLRDAGIDALSDALPEILASGLNEQRYGDIPRWRTALEQLPNIEITDKTLSAAVVSANVDSCSRERQQQLDTALKGLHPWRKGPYEIAGVYIDTEWRSDLKWQRLLPYISSLAGRTVLDVGCGSGYHCWRMSAEGAALVVGIDPTPLFIMQYWALQKYLQQHSVWVLPARMESMPPRMQAFDTVFSMGVLYHRRSPLDHLLELKQALVDGGELVLETLVIEGGESEVLVPEGRYSKMANVWFIPSARTLCSWLRKLKFKNVRLVDVSQTTTQEQRSTEWMTFQSLVDFLDPDDINKTVEGYPAPKRAIVIATN